MQAVTVSHRSDFAQLLISERQRIVRRAIEKRDAETVRRVEEPGIGVRQREEMQTISGLEAQSEIFAFAQEVAGRELRLHEEAGPLGVAAAELDVVLAFFVALDSDVDRFLFLIDLEIRIVGDLEVYELTELVEALLEGLHIHDLPLFEEDLAAQDLVLGRVVALEL